MLSPRAHAIIDDPCTCKEKRFSLRVQRSSIIAYEARESNYNGHNHYQATLLMQEGVHWGKQVSRERGPQNALKGADACSLIFVKLVICKSALCC